MGEKKDGRPATYAELEALPPNLVGEIVDDQLYASPRPASPHAVAASGLAAAVFGPFCFDRDGPGGWWLLVEPELHLGSNVLVPDLSGWRRERMPSVPDAPYFTLAPDWLCEVVSPRTGALDRIRKMPAYAKAGVTHAWLLDPLERSLEVFRLVDGRWTVAQGWDGDVRVRAEPFEEIEIDLSRLWLPGK
jgi:Uma2 family endonuclease